MSPRNNASRAISATLRAHVAQSGATPTLSAIRAQVALSMTLAVRAILLKKKVGEEIATLLPPPSFDGTDKPRAPFMAQSGGAR